MLKVHLLVVTDFAKATYKECVVGSEQLTFFTVCLNYTFSLLMYEEVTN